MEVMIIQICAPAYIQIVTSAFQITIYTQSTPNSFALKFYFDDCTFKFLQMFLEKTAAEAKL